MSLKVLAFAGSLRKGSYNKLALRAAMELKPADMDLEVFDLAPIPVYNEDLREQGFPPAVESFRDKIRKADALLIVTPEYNYSMPGVLKNAIDWGLASPGPAVQRQARGHHGGRRVAYSVPRARNTIYGAVACSSTCTWSTSRKS